MKQVRKLSNLVAEELQNALDEKGMVLEESAFEEKVSQIVSDIYESVEEGKVEDDEPITEDDKFYMATSECSVGDIDVLEGEYVEIEDTDDGRIATVYDEDGEVRETDIYLDDDEDLDLEALEELEDDDDEVDLDEGKDCEGCNKGDEEVEEGPVKKFKVKNGKKVKLSKNQIKRNKLKAQGRLKKGFKFVDGKQVKMSSAERMARKKAGKKLAMKGKAMRKKSMKKARAIAAGSVSGTVSESFQIHSDALTFTAEEGDVITMEDSMITILREGKEVLSGLAVSEGFMDRCFEEEVLNKEDENCANCKECGSKIEEEDENCKECGSGVEEEGEEVANEAVLTFRANQGYILVSEGTELPMGNRIRARGTLNKNGYSVTSEMLDAASNGEMVTLSK